MEHNSSSQVNLVHINVQGSIVPMYVFYQYHLILADLYLSNHYRENMIFGEKFFVFLVKGISKAIFDVSIQFSFRFVRVHNYFFKI